MSFITRKDGTHFVIPSYRDVLTVKQKSQLQKDIQLLSQSYGDYITLQKKSPTQYEVAFSPDTGYLLGESVWHQFNKPADMIYCEARQDTNEAILVIVKAGSVYLDGSFPVESIPEELIIFLTQQNSFEIYTYGDVPISETPAAGKFSFEATSITLFKELEAPIFDTLPLLKIYQLQPVEVVIKSQGLGASSTQPIILLIVLAALAWGAWELYSYLSAPPPAPIVEVNPYEKFYQALASPAPDKEIEQFLITMQLFGTMPGWYVQKMSYTNRNYLVSVTSKGGKIEALLSWAQKNGFTSNIQQNGITITAKGHLPNRPAPDNIYPIKNIIAVFVDKIAVVYPGNPLKLENFISQGVFTSVKITMTLSEVSPMVLMLICKQIKGLPLTLNTMTLQITDANTLTGSITLEALGS